MRPLTTLLLSLLSLTLATPPQCTAPTLSCSSSSAGSTTTDTCCTVSPGGLLLQTQFWDYSPSVGPSDSWTLHGLWPDNCDGSYDANCDSSRAYTNITDILGAAKGGDELLNYMQKVWVPDRGSAEVFWEHEWGKHGTCISTLDPDCYTDYVPQEEVVDFFNITVQLFQTLDTYSILSAASITPSTTQTYTLTSIISALSAARSGLAPTISCDSHGAIQQVWYYFLVKGSVQTGEFVPTGPPGSHSSIASSADSDDSDAEGFWEDGARKVESGRGKGKKPKTTRGGCPKRVKYLPKKGSGYSSSNNDASDSSSGSGGSDTSAGEGEGDEEWKQEL